MKLKNVYIGYTKDGKERLLYKYYANYCDIDCSIYTDLRTKERFNSLDVLSDTLVPFKEMSNSKYAFKRKVKSIYKNNKKLLYHVDNLFLGDICKVDWVDSVNEGKYYQEINCPMAVSFCTGNKLFVQLSSYEYRDLKTSKVYKIEGDSSLNIGDFCVNNLRNASKELEFTPNELVSKNYALRKRYQEYGKK